MTNLKVLFLVDQHMYIYLMCLRRKRNSVMIKIIINESFPRINVNIWERGTQFFTVHIWLVKAWLLLIKRPISHWSCYGLI